MNARMPALKQCFEAAGWTNVRTVRASGNVVFDAPSASVAVHITTRTLDTVAACARA